MPQSRYLSLLKAVTNFVVGYALAVLTQLRRVFERWR
jgi:hypothetical protein